METDTPVASARPLKNDELLASGESLEIDASVASDASLETDTPVAKRCTTGDRQTHGERESTEDWMLRWRAMHRMETDEHVVSGEPMTAERVLASEGWVETETILTSGDSLETG